MKKLLTFSATSTNTLNQTMNNNTNNEITGYSETNSTNSVQYQSYSAYNQSCNSLNRDICTNQNCDLNIVNNCNLLRSPAGSCRQNYTNNNRNQIPKEVQTSDHIAVLNTNSANRISDIRPQQQQLIGNVNNTSDIGTDNQSKILPPPLFDNNMVLNINNSCNEIPKTPSQKRFHRTIPRHFQAVDPILSNQIKSTQNHDPVMNQSTMNNMKKPTCQCPVQHVPMTYMGTNHFNNQSTNPGNMFITKMTSSNKQSSVKHQKVYTYQPQSQNLISVSKIPTISKPNDEDNNSSINPLNAAAAESTGTNIGSSSHFNILNSESIVLQDEGTLKRIKNMNQAKVYTASVKKNESIGNSSNQQQIHSILKNSNKVNNASAVACKITTNYEIVNSPFSFQLIDSAIGVTKSNKVKNNNESQQLSINPVLPPKLHKNINNSCSNINKQMFQNNTNSYYSNSKIHTITRPQELGQFTVLANRMSFPTNSVTQKNHLLTKSLSRGTDLIEKSQKRNSPSMNISNNCNNNTLPKNINGKMTMRSSITEVVNKVPSIINIPTPNEAISAANKPNAIVTSTIIAPLTSLPLQCSSSMNLLSKTLPKKLPTKISKPENSNPSTSTGMKVIKSCEKPLPVLTTSNNCVNPKEHFLPNDTSLDDEYLSECENCKSAHGSRYYLEEELEESPQETMTLQRKMPENNEDNDQQNYYRVSSTLPTNTNKKTP